MFNTWSKYPPLIRFLVEYSTVPIDPTHHVTNFQLVLKYPGSIIPNILSDHLDLARHAAPSPILITWLPYASSSPLFFTWLGCCCSCRSVDRNMEQWWWRWERRPCCWMWILVRGRKRLITWLPETTGKGRSYHVTTFSLGHVTGGLLLPLHLSAPVRVACFGSLA